VEAGCVKFATLSSHTTCSHSVSRVGAVLEPSWATSGPSWGHPTATCWGYLGAILMCYRYSVVASVVGVGFRLYGIACIYCCAHCCRCCCRYCCERRCVLSWLSLLLLRLSSLSAVLVVAFLSTHTIVAHIGTHTDA